VVIDNEIDGNSGAGVHGGNGWQEQAEARITPKFGRCVLSIELSPGTDPEIILSQRLNSDVCL
jgi:hypothetical protein